MVSLFDLKEIENKIQQLEQRTMQEGFWNDSKTSSVVLQEMKFLKNKHTKFVKIAEELANLKELNDLLLLEEDSELVKELLKNTKVLEHELEKFEIETLLSRKI